MLPQTYHLFPVVLVQCVIVVRFDHSSVGSDALGKGVYPYTAFRKPERRIGVSQAVKRMSVARIVVFKATAFYELRKELLKGTNRLARCAYEFPFALTRVYTYS